MPDLAPTILERFRLDYGKDIDLTLRPAYRQLLETFGNPQDHLPPVFHIAGTNGKGSTCAFLRAILEAAGCRVHVYTSPHLLRFHERIRLAGQLIEDGELSGILLEIEAKAVKGTISYFEAATAAAFIAFQKHKADFVILETGLGGRLDATNVVPKPLATLITRLSYDHRDYLGETIDKIAEEKAGIMRDQVPCFTVMQPEKSALEILREKASLHHTSLAIEGVDWHIEIEQNQFRFKNAVHTHILPQPALIGRHQYQNAALAIAALSVLPHSLSQAVIAEGLRTVEWPARLQPLKSPYFLGLVPEGTEIWLDGGHNDSAGEVLARQIQEWHHQDGKRPKSLCVIMGMLTTKYPQEFLQPFAQDIAHLITVPVPHEPLSFEAGTLAEEVRKCGLAHVTTAPDVPMALRSLDPQDYGAPLRILICGSLYLAGAVLALPHR